MKDRPIAPGRALDVVALGLVLVAAWFVVRSFLAVPGWPDSHEGLRYVVLADRFVDAIRQGELYPRYLSDLYGGYGYPVFCFYQPALFYLAAPLVWVRDDPAAGLRWTVLILTMLGGVGAWRLATLLAGRVVGLFGAAVFLITPYLCVELYVRGDLSEFMGMMVSPWVLYATLALARRVASSRDATVATLSLSLWLGLLVTSHPAPALFLAPISAVIALGVGLGRPWGRAYWLRFAVAAAMAAAATSPYWATLLEMRSYVGFDRLTSRYFAPELHLLASHQLVSLDWGFGGSLTDSTEDTMPFQLGAMHLGLAVAGAWLGRRSRAIVIASVAYALLITLMLEVARPIWEQAGFVRFLQFPWRLLSVTAVMQLVAAVGIHGAYRRWIGDWPRPKRYGVTAGCLLVWLVVATIVQREQFEAGRALDPTPTVDRYRSDGEAPQFRMLGGVAEYVPLTARERPPRPRDRSRPPFRVNGPGTVSALSESAYDLHCRVEADREVALVIERVYLPEWEVTVNGDRMSRADLERGLSPHGFMRFPLPPGLHEIRARYVGPPGRVIRDVVAFTVILAGALLLLVLRRRG